MDLYLFDLDRTLDAYNLRYRLPELARLSGASQCGSAPRRWAVGYETGAEVGE